MNPEFWRGRRVLLTGHTGFKGSWLTMWLHSMGAKVTGVALEPPSEPSLFEAARVEGIIDDKRADVRDMKALTEIFETCKPDIVFHLAAQALVREGYRDPLGTFSTNVIGTANVLEAIRAQPQVRAAVVVTSDKCYDNDESGRPFKEGDRLGGYDPYSSSKACAELVTSSFWRSFLRETMTGVATVRAGNVIGGGDWAKDRLLPDMIRGFSSSTAVRIRNPAAIRPWQHVLEPLSGCLLLAEALATGGRGFTTAWNFGPPASDARTVAYLATKAASVWGAGARWEVDARPQPHEAHHLELDSARARDLLNWRPRWHVDRAIEETVAWYVSHVDGGDMYQYSLAQIEAFLGTQNAAA